MRKPLDEFVYSESVVMAIVRTHRNSLKRSTPTLNVDICVRKFVKKAFKSGECRTVKIKMMECIPAPYWRIRIFEREKPVQKYTYDDYIQENG